MSASSYHHIGVDLGGTHLRAAVVNTGTGEIVHLKQVSTLSREGYDRVVQRMGQLVDDVIVASKVPRAQIGGVGIGAPGMLDIDGGVVLFLPNLPGNWVNVPLRQRIEEQVQLPTHLLNDARAMTLGEWKFGAGRGVETMACFTLGTGIGGGLVINGRLHLGINGSAGELGHQVIEANGLPCGCGSRGCLEVYASGPAIAAMGMKAIAQGLTTRLGEMVAYDLNRITPAVVFQAAQEGDTIALDIFERAGTYLGIAIANICAAIAPRKVVIGGGVSQAGEVLLGPARRMVRERMHILPVDQVQIILAELGINAGLVGAAAWASLND